MQLSSLLLFVELRTMHILAANCGTLLSLVIKRVVLELFPPVAAGALNCIWTGFSVFKDFVCCVPSGALIVLVVVQIGLATIVLPVVSKYTRFPVVLFFLVGAPHCLKVE